MHHERSAPTKPFRRYADLQVLLRRRMALWQDIGAPQVLRGNAAILR